MNKETMTEEEVEDIGQLVSNAVYAAVCDHIQKYEKRGYNAHQRAQHICEYAKRDVRYWLIAQYDVGREIGIADDVLIGSKWNKP